MTDCSGQCQVTRSKITPKSYEAPWGADPPVGPPLDAYPDDSEIAAAFEPLRKKLEQDRTVPGHGCADVDACECVPTVKEEKRARDDDEWTEPRTKMFIFDMEKNGKQFRVNATAEIRSIVLTGVCQIKPRSVKLAAVASTPGHGVTAESCGKVSTPEVTLGESRICDVYGDDASSQLIGMIDVVEKKLYVRSGQEDRVARVFGVNDLQKRHWTTPLKHIAGKYELADLAKLDRTRPILAHNAYALADRECVPYPAKSCIDFFDNAGAFRYSWKAPIAVFLCTRSADEVCTETWQTNRVTLYPQPGCTGKPFVRQRTWAFCTVD